MYETSSNAYELRAHGKSAWAAATCSGWTLGRARC